MTVELARPRAAARPAAPIADAPRDAAFAARPRLVRLRDALVAAAREPVPRRSPWREPPVFFFDPARQAELVAARAAPLPPAPHPLAAAIARELFALCESVEVRRAARAIPRLREAAQAVPIANDLADLLAVPDDEIVLVLHPALRLGYRLRVRGVATANHFQLLMLDAIGDFDDLPPVRAVPSRFVRACREADPVVPAGVPMAAELPFQLLRPSAVEADGNVPAGFRGCNHWFWGWEPLAAAPRVDGERAIVLGEPAFRMTWEVERRFPAMAAEVELIQVLSPFQVAERLSRLVGRDVPVRTDVREEAFGKAA